MTRVRPATSARSPWFPFSTMSGGAEIRLCRLPPAAGYRPWSARTEVVPIQLPGWQSSFVEDRVTSTGELVDQLADAVEPENGPRFALFGHSAGVLARWSELTIAGFRCRSLPGGHHHLYDDPADVVGVVSETLLDPAEPSR
jgi:surfactin synthase thioesterase subunit